MPILVPPLLLILISALAHLLRDERLSLRTNGIISGVSVILLVALISVKFGFTLDFWNDVLILVLYVFLLIKELIDLLLYCISADSPIAHGDEAVTVPVSASVQGWEREGMEPRG